MTTSNESIKVTPNYSKKTFTLRLYIDGKLFAKYRTITMNQEEFENCQMNTESDWKQFLKCDEYYRV